jgi:hypothetical protein
MKKSASSALNRRISGTIFTAVDLSPLSEFAVEHACSGSARDRRWFTNLDDEGRPTILTKSEVGLNFRMSNLHLTPKDEISVIFGASGTPTGGASIAIEFPLSGVQTEAPPR